VLPTIAFELELKLECGEFRLEDGLLLRPELPELGKPFFAGVECSAAYEGEGCEDADGGADGGGVG